MASERKFIEENIKRVLLREYLMRVTERAGFGGLDIQRTPLGTRITLIAERPGMIIGRRGRTIAELTEIVEKKFKLDNPQIEVQEVENPDLNPSIMAQKLASALERGWHFRRAAHSTLRRVMAAGAKGCQVIISGKLTGQRHRMEKVKEGHIKFCGEPAEQWMKEGFAIAKKKSGVIGVKVQIMDPNARLPDEINITAPPPSAPTEAETEVEVEAEAEPEAGAEAEAEVESEKEGEEEKAETEQENETPEKHKTTGGNDE